MKKKFYFATLVIALLTFTGCANDEYVGDQQNLGEQNGAIAFSTKSENTVRGETRDPDAPAKLNRQFWVYGTKTVGSNDPQPVFNNYKVVYQSGTASSSNTSGWEYVGIEGTDPAQTIKYWDYSADQYDFEAYSYNSTRGSVKKKITPTPEEVTSGLAVNDYEVTGAPDDLYFAQRKTMQKQTNGGTYGVVELTFKSVLSKIRVGFYETIPGYSVKIDGFYGLNTNGDDWAAEVSENNNNFVAWCPNKKIDNNMSFVVRYGTGDNAIPAVTKVKNSEEMYQAISDDGYKLNQQLELGSNFFLPSNEDKTIGDSYSTVTWDKVDANDNNNNKSLYTYFIPQNQLGNGQVKEMKIKVDYTLTSTDDSGEVIKVTGATAIVPKEYLQWAPNTAYSYVFKISDNTNGTTGDPSTTEPAGLYPITFDAVVEQMEDYRKDYLTTVSDLSITATQDGPFADADKAVFKKDDVIKVKVMRYNGSDPVDIRGGLNQNVETDKFYAVFVNENTYNPNKSIEDYFDEATSTTTYDTSEKVFTLDSPSDAAGYWIVKVTFKVGNETITKYAVLKVGIETPSTSGNGEGQGA